MFILSRFIDYILPPRCLNCRTLTLNDDGFCPSCFKQINFISEPLCRKCGSSFTLDISKGTICARCYKTMPFYDKARALLKFDQYSKKAIHDFKYNDKSALAKVYARLIHNNYKDEIKEVDCILPVPMHKLKRMMRMYNQAYVLAKEIALIANKPLYHDVLIKSKWSKPQASLRAKDRLKNLNDSFYIKNDDLIFNKKVLLVDDVITTGTTINECSKLLKKAKCQTVIVVAIAKT